MRPPLQGGLPPVGAVLGAVVEIACDESGFSGSNLLDPVTPVITHASVDVSADEAAELLATLRSGFRRSLDEVKSGRFLRDPDAGAALAELLAALRGRAHVHLIDKEFFLVTRIVDLFLAEPSYAAGTRLTEQQRPAALALYRAGPSAGPDWAAFLAAFVELVRTKRRHEPDLRALDRFFRARDALSRNVRGRDAHGLDAHGRGAHGPDPHGPDPHGPDPHGPDRQRRDGHDAHGHDAPGHDAPGHDAHGREGLGPSGEAVLDRLSRTRVRAVLARLTDGDPSIPPPLEPMLPALAETVLFWSRGQRRVLVMHDEQSALTAARLRRLQQALADGAKVSPLAGLVTVDSRDDPRVQVADLLAGVARRWPGVDDGPLQPFLSPTSLRDPRRRPAAGR